jgi:WhiB family redox-sensing transcriptional regulator
MNGDPTFIELREPLGAWAAEAACIDKPLDWWFPGSAPNGANLDEVELAPTARIAMAICHTCPVEQQCLQHALRNDEVHGIWGGKSERARARLRRGLRTKGSAA